MVHLFDVVWQITEGGKINTGMAGVPIKADPAATLPAVYCVYCGSLPQSTYNTEWEWPAFTAI